jgi:Acyl-CoA reductase (LuxC)
VLDLQKRIQAFEKLGEYLKNLSSDELQHLKSLARSKNNWFTPESIDKALEGIQTYLDKTDLEQWTTKYPKISEVTPKKVAIVMAGNIPAVGFHDFLSVLISGHIVLARPSSEDEAIIKKIGQILIEIEPQFAERIEFVEKINAADAIIATGSDNTARYFEYYFAKKPHIIRKNRVSVGILDGTETKEDFENLGKDIFTYFGLGCRNVSKLYVPENYKFDPFFEGIQSFELMANHNKYFNNYEYNKSVYLLKPIVHFDNGFLLLSESSEIASPVACMFYETYQNKENLQEKLSKYQEKIQCIVSKQASWKDSYAFGDAQNPRLWDYADNVDTMEFLTSI